MADAFTLHFPDHVRVSGEILQGHVEVNVPMLLSDKVENVRIQVRGSIATKVKVLEYHPASGNRQAGYQSVDKTHTENVLEVNLQIWDHFTTTQGAGTLTCPFQIPLPPRLPPSFQYSTMGGSVAISYSIAVVGERHGIFHANRQVARVFSVVPQASEEELNTVGALTRGWNGPWRTLVNTKSIRHGIIFGEYSEAKVELVLPALDSLPVFTPIPFTFHVLTRTKPVHHSDLSHKLEKHEKLFPAPPASPAEVQFRLYLHGGIRAAGASEKIDAHYDLKGSLGDDEEAAVGAVRTVTDEPEWVPGEPGHKDKGVWKRGVHFEGRFTLPFAPTYHGSSVEWHHSLRFKVDFPGIGNDLELEVPVVLHSCAARPAPQGPAYQPNTVPPPMLNMPMPS
ncbi:hypothetical protein C8R46DRAFT_1198230 [Mycena filopes]|nr:hypothetical protein C8R46DRAFT_1198230 [Mycena filopes]